MMREILFRGKTDKGEWVVGNLMVYYDGSASIIESSTSLNTFHVILPETVGQYTGLTDKKGDGTKIFEGDILAFRDRLVYVHWHDYCGCWDCSDIKAIEGEPTLYEDRTPNMWRYDAEVIGNIHDNPELLKGGAE